MQNSSDSARDSKMSTSKVTALAVAALVFLACGVAGQKDLVPDSLTPLELWNAATWFYPFGIAGSNAWSDYLKNAQEASNQLYKRVETASGGLNFLNGLGGLGVPPAPPKTSSSASNPPQPASTGASPTSGSPAANLSEPSPS